MITPILRDPRPQGGTLYTFPSASRDLTRAFSNSEYEFAFSHFACLNLPDFKYGSFDNGNVKGIYLNDLQPNSIELFDNLNTSLKWHLQSYMMNYEVAILNGFSLDSGQYDQEILKTPSERIFFNWLQKVNGIKIAGSAETLDGYGDDIDPNVTVDNSLFSEHQLSNLTVEDRKKSYKIGNKLYTWKGGEWRGRVLVSKTVQYIGTIDMVNNVNIDYDSFNEIYLNIPADAGGSTNVYFDAVYDKNYQKGEIIDVDNDKYSIDAEYIIGRSLSDTGVDEYTLRAIYDNLNNGGDSDSDKMENLHSYKVETGYCINFNDDKYGVNGIEGMNLNSNEDFEFNCVLIYYRIRKGNGSWYTNLYGVLFLEEVTISDFNINNNEEDERLGYIQRYPKFKKGNSWGLKLDLKIDAQPDSQMSLRDREYSDPNNSGDGMQLFTEALMQLNDCVKLFYEVKKENSDIKEKIYSLENVMSGVDSMAEMRKDIDELSLAVGSINSLEGRIEEIENNLVFLSKNLGHLIDAVNSLKQVE
ncbi:MAG: hypothetical protein J6V44_03180 [Methanobrevibacter sp.]|nr:hypothetical protein [Methanobrevibacter sp.]